MSSERNFSPEEELSALIYNKLQTARTALELIKDNKKVPKEYINRAIEDLEKVVKIIA